MTLEPLPAPREPVLRVSVEVRDRGSSPETRFEAELAGFAVLREAGRTPWEAISRLIAPWAAGAAVVVMTPDGYLGQAVFRVRDYGSEHEHFRYEVNLAV